MLSCQISPTTQPCKHRLRLSNHETTAVTMMMLRHPSTKMKIETTDPKLPIRNSENYFNHLKLLGSHTLQKISMQNSDRTHNKRYSKCLKEVAEQYVLCRSLTNWSSSILPDSFTPHVTAFSPACQSSRAPLFPDPGHSYLAIDTASDILII